MNNKKVLSAAILLILAKSALAIEVVEIESNNTSTLATELKLDGIENVGQLSDGNDVDFFTIATSGIKDEKGVIQYNDVSLSFACNSRALASKNSSFGWYLTIHDSFGGLQSSYQVDPEECATGTASSKGPYNFKIPKPTSGELEVKYYLSVVGDCRKPAFNISSDPLISINTTDKPATKSNTDKAIKALFDTQTILNNTKTKLSDFNKDLSLTTISDAIDTAQKNIISNGSSELKNIKLLSAQTPADIDIDDYMSTATDITKAPYKSKAQIDTVKSTLATVKSLLNAANSSITLTSPTITTAKDNVITFAKKITPTSIKADIDDLIVKIDNFNVEIDRLNSSIDNLNSTVTNLNTTVTTAQDICTASNTANYTIKDNPDTAIAPYKSIKEKSIVLGKENSGQNGSVSDVDFFELAGSETDVIPLKFSCAKNSAKGKEQGWVLSAWKPNDSNALDKPDFVYQVAPADCNAPEVYSIQLPQSAKNYYIGVQSACGLPPRDTSTTLQSSYYSNSTSLDYLCDANTANFTLKRDFKTAIPLILDEEKTGEMSSRSDYDLFVVENNATEDYSMNFSCKSPVISATNEKPSWKISAYDDSDKLVPSYPKLVKGSECNAGIKLDKLPKNAPRYYLAVEPASSTDTKPDTSKYTIKKEKTVIAPIPDTPGTVTPVALGDTKLFSIIEKGQIVKKVDKEGVASFSTFNYYVDGSSKRETELVFSCSAPKILFSNNWKVSIYKSDKTLKEAYIINSNDCIPDKLTGESSYIMTIPQESARFYVQVKSMCEDSSCTFDDSEFTITRKSDIPPVITNPETTTPTKTAFTPYSNVVAAEILDKNLYKKRIKTVSDIHFYSVTSSSENDVPVEFSCLKSTETTGWTVSIWEYDSTDANKAGWLYKQYQVLPKDCTTAATKLTVPSSSNAHYISIQSSCLTAPETNESELIISKTCKVNTASYSIKRAAESSTVAAATTIPIVIAPTVITSPVVVDPIVTALSSAKNIGTSQKNKLKSATDIQTYYVDTGTKSNANFEFSCPTSTRFTNDWTLLIYNSEKVLKETKVINGSDCGTGLLGDSGAFTFSSVKDSTRTYLVIKSACDAADKTCVVDKSQYEIKRVISTNSSTTTNVTPVNLPCFHDVCDVVKDPDLPVFGAN